MPASEARGARNVRLGVAIAAGALLGLGITRAIAHGGLSLRGIALTAAFGLVAMGVIAGSNVARGAMIVLGFTFLRLLGDLPEELARQRAGYGRGMSYLIVLAATGFLYVAGTVLANWTPSAIAYHRERDAARAERKRRKVKSLAEWRASPGADEGA